MKPTFLIQTNGIHCFHVKESWEAAQRYGSVEEAVVIPFDNTLDNDFDATGKFVIPYGSDRLRRIGLREGWEGVFYNENLSMAASIEHRDDMLNGDGRILKIGDLQNEDIVNELSDPFFMKPSEDNKAFAASTCTKQRIMSWLINAKLSDNANFDAYTEILVAPIKETVSEYRYFIVGGEVVTGSLYFLGGRQISVNIDDEFELLDEAQKIADKWLPHETCVMDTCLIKDENGKHHIKVVEFNCLNSSGFYDHDFDKIFKKLGEYYGS